MDIANINALTRTGYYPSPRAEKSAVAAAPLAARDTARNTQQPIEYVVQGELLQKRRTASPNDSYNLLDAMRNMDEMLRQSASGAETRSAWRDSRRAIASYTASATIPNNLTGSTAAAFVDYYV